MKSRTFALVALLLSSVAFGACLGGNARAGDSPSQKASKESAAGVVTVTGTIEPQVIVEVGATVGGRIQALGSSSTHGAIVKKGEVLAQIDPAHRQAEVAMAKASVQRAQADLCVARAKVVLAERDLDRARQVANRSEVAVSEAALGVAKAGLAAEEAGVAYTQAALSRAESSLNACTIRSPIDGVILDSRATLGQNVSDGSGAPALFLIAGDLQKLEIWAAVPETEIGRIAKGQNATFSVSAFPKETFRASVRQVRLNATLFKNQVTYKVVLDCENVKGKLLPYMTANIAIAAGGGSGTTHQADTRQGQQKPPRPETAREKRDALWAAVRAGDTKAIGAALDNGADVNAKNEIGVSALWIAANKGKLDVVDLLVKRGADVNVRDGIWYMTPLGMSVEEMKTDVAKSLIKSGAKDVDAALAQAASVGNRKMVETILGQAKVSQGTLDAGLYSATHTMKNAKVRDLLTKAGAKPLPAASKKDRESWAKLVGTYEGDNGGSLKFELKDVGLVFGGRWLKPIGPDTFVPLGSEGARIRFERRGDKVNRVIVSRFTAEYSFYRFTKPELKASSVDVGTKAVASPLNWPSFRGPNGTGLADGQQPPTAWDVKSGKNVRWKTAIPGLGHSGAIVWGNRVFVTTAISGDPNPKIRVGNYGDVDSVNDKTKHTWQVLCLDRDSGKILWQRTAYVGVPKIKRHMKGSQANCTPATDGRHVIACFGSEGLYCYNFAGKLLWKRDLSTLDSSFAIEQEYEWGFGNSPTIYEGLVILQCDLSHDSFIAAFRLDDGAKAWSTSRDEIPSWSSPVVWHNSNRDEIVTNASQYARSYDPKTGAELWRLAKKSEATIPTPVCGKDLLYITSGNRPIQPIFAIKPGATGDISLKKQENKNAYIVWSKLRGGPYMPTPILYGPYFYTCSNSGIVACYDAKTGNEIYRKRMGFGSYTASPIAADGRLYFCSEQGEVRVVKAGPEFELLAVNPLGDYVMATPAISNGSLFVRSQHFLFSLAKTEPGGNPSKSKGEPAKSSTVKR